MIKACVIGWPIKHSRSPLIHNFWLNKYGIEGSYEKVAVEPQGAKTFLGDLKGHGFSGCNVTVPHKQTAFEIAEVKDASARAVGAANTLWLDEAGRTCASNTDTEGFMAHLTATVPDWRETASRPVAILGAGGAARAIVYGFQTAGVKNIHVYNRTSERARELAETLGPEVKHRKWDERTNAPAECSVIVNTTTIGMNGEGSLEIDFKSASPDCVVCDIVYVPLETDFLKRARQARLRTVDGLGMLLHQAAPGFEKWFGVRPEITPDLRDHVLADLNKT